MLSLAINTQEYYSCVLIAKQEYYSCVLIAKQSSRTANSNIFCLIQPVIEPPTSPMPDESSVPGRGEYIITLKVLPGLTLGCQSWGGLSPPTEKNGGEFQG